MLRDRTGLQMRDLVQDGRECIFTRFEGKPSFRLTTPRETARLANEGIDLLTPQFLEEGSDPDRTDAPSASALAATAGDASSEGSISSDVASLARAVIVGASALVDGVL